MLATDIQRQDNSEASRVSAFLRRTEDLDGPGVLGAAVAAFPGQIAVVSSFGAESAVLLAIVAELDRDIPVLFLDTGKHFAETLDYRHSLAARLGLRDVRDITPDERELHHVDADGDLWVWDPDACCAARL